jgi:hypothetical protein
VKVARRKKKTQAGRLWLSLAKGAPIYDIGPPTPSTPIRLLQPSSSPIPTSPLSSIGGTGGNDNESKVAGSPVSRAMTNTNMNGMAMLSLTGASASSTRGGVSSVSNASSSTGNGSYNIARQRYNEWGMISWRSNGVTSKTRTLRLSQVTELKLGLPTYVQISRLRAATASLMGKAPANHTHPTAAATTTATAATPTRTSLTNYVAIPSTSGPPIAIPPTPTSNNSQPSLSSNESNSSQSVVGSDGIGHDQLQRCLSLVTTARTLDIIAPNDHTFKLWITGLQPLLRNATVSDHRTLT